MPTPQEMLERFQDSYALGDEAIDHTHREFLELCLAAANATGPEFAEAFKALFEHTSHHFADEEAKMQASGYPAFGEHRANHQRILGDMDRFCQRAAAGRAQMARAWLNDSLPAWFDLHAKTMDSALVVHLRQHG
ncbi:hemerythrin HHE cation-binding protein [Azotobacter chroococcum]|uniref:Hemerythrin-like, metal binding protein n=2 Tax=Azotobacter chroococcum TaxID=353 RepID=A0A0C4WFH0_9GAMM|nr:hemerythrin domain-containing protein [Azotobacter chroococcum]AJE19523.1 Hemerythrin-like, metal binding protein [Azotobacter chroococcum NCIMB 8003]QQE88823.1 hemerythrin domain-containing protein [Azotobacter chroococcum]TBW08076.1 hemerythrin HHE cation-binding protein [Azotobacter chroococcum]TBW36537.1 hemerythrin HHE cation-binding protein [Azotobacter chroococcum]TKD29984.1 hemerythrin HHE cation-binding protein [Azotobacter chroococcum]